MPTNQELALQIQQQDKLIEAYRVRLEALEAKVQGDGVIILSGNRLKVDLSGSLSDFQLKSS